MTPPFTHHIVLPDGTDAEQVDTGNYLVDYHAGGRTLVVTFENRDYGAKDPGRFAWGFQKLRQWGHSILGVKVKRPDWYLQPDLAAFFASKAVQRLMARHARTLFYGSSMGGYAALRYALPGSEVLALNPQTSLHPLLAPGDDRFPDGSALDWSDPATDARIGAARAGRVFVAYDPLCALDRRHVDRLGDANLVRLKLPLVGHTLPAHLAYLGQLETVLHQFVDGALTRVGWAALMRSRRGYSHYYLTMALHPRARPAVAARAIGLAFRSKPFLPSALDLLAEAAERHGLWTEATTALAAYRALTGDDAAGSPAAARIEASGR